MMKGHFYVPLRSFMMQTYTNRRLQDEVFGTLFTLFLVVVAFAGSASTAEQGSVWITDATIISPENLDHIEKGGC